MITMSKLGRFVLIWKLYWQFGVLLILLFYFCLDTIWLWRDRISIWKITMVRKTDSSIFLTKDAEEVPEKSKINRTTKFLCLIGIGIIGTIAVMEAMKGTYCFFFLYFYVSIITTYVRLIRLCLVQYCITRI